MLDLMRKANFWGCKFFTQILETQCINFVFGQNFTVACRAFFEASMYYIHIYSFFDFMNMIYSSLSFRLRYLIMKSVNY